MKPIFTYLLLFCLISCVTPYRADDPGLQKVGLLTGHTRSQHEAFEKNIMITTQGVETTKAGLRMIELGGNAFDAAAAISFAISVERPHSTGIGGGGFMVVDGPLITSPEAIDFREKAPLKGHSKMFLEKDGSPSKDKSIDGVLASGVPGLVKGVYEMHKKYGALPWNKVVQPAIDLARNGFKVYPNLAKALKYRKDVLSRFPASVKIFFSDGEPLAEGDLLIQEDLAKTLEAIRDNGPDGFYKGWVARSITKEFKKRGGLITQKDLDLYNVKWRKPVEGKYKDYKIYSMPPPSSGGTHVIQILNTLEPFNLKSSGVQSAKTIHRTATAMQLAFVDRARYMGDSDFIKVPIKGLTSKSYSKTLTSKINNKALKIKEDDLLDAFKYESDETTHFTIADGKGNIVSSTQTINYWMGSGHVVPGTGIVMNDEMDDFSIKEGASNFFGAVGGKNNLVEPEKRPLSSMSPTIVKKDGKTILALGTPSGTRILTCVAQVMLNYLEHELSLWDAVSATRIHHQWSPDSIRIGNPGFELNTESKLLSMGHKLEKKNLGCKIQAISIERGKLHGVSDPRGEGLAKGL